MNHYFFNSLQNLLEMANPTPRPTHLQNNT